MALKPVHFGKQIINTLTTLKCGVGDEEGRLSRSREILSITYTGRFIMFSVITNIYNKKTKGPTLMGLFTATGKLKKFLLTTRDVRFVHHG
jgi:hypothetical protein